MKILATIWTVLVAILMIIFGIWNVIVFQNIVLGASGVGSAAVLIVISIMLASDKRY